MRADRLVSILMLLQSRGKLPAGELARALDVSVRTIYRDMDALSAAGIPVYAERGPEGGCRLVEDYRTDLTGLNEDEARALFLLTAPGPLDALEAGQKLRSALRKLAAALPAYRGGGAGENQKLLLDWSGGGRAASTGGALLQVVYNAVMDQRKLRLAYRLFIGIEVEQEACPLGLVARADEWHLAWRSPAKLHWQRVSDLLRAEPLDARFDVPPDFDLASAWQAACADREAGETAFCARVRITPGALAWLARRSGVHVLSRSSQADGHGRVEAELGFVALEAARGNLLGLGRSVLVLAPEALRLSMADYARQVLGLYEGQERPAPAAC
jgi:predicted DNA-binding transcriptional regulator YafY